MQPQPGQPQQPSPLVPQPPRKTKRVWLIVGVVVLLLAVCGALGNAVSHNGRTPAISVITASSTQPGTPPKPTSKPTQVHKPAWTTVANFSGNGSKKTATFSVPDDWKIVWKCDHSSFQGYDYNVIILVYNSDGTLADSGVNTLCSKSNEQGETEIRTAGNVYLDVTSEAVWSVQIQELK